MPTSPDPGSATLGGLRLLAGAVSGRPLEVRPEPLTDPRAYLTGGILVVDAGALATDPADVRAQVVVQAAMLAAGSHAPNAMRALLGRTRATGRYCALEGVRAVRALADRVPPGVLRRVTDAAEAGIPLTGGAEESRALALSSATLPLAPDFFGRLRPLSALRSGAPAAAPDTTGGATGREEEDDGDDRDEGEESRLLKLLANPLTGDNPIGRMFRSMFGSASAPSDEQGDEGSGPSSTRVATTVPPGRRRGTPVAEGALARLQAPGGGSVRYPEWDQRAGRYRPDWVTVHDADPWVPDGARDLSGLVLAPRPVIKQGLVRAALAPQARGRAGHGEQPHPDGVVDLALWARHPEGPPPMPFVDVRRTRPDVAVLVLLDASDSTGDETLTGESVFDQHLALAHRLAAGCEGVGLPVGLYAFQAWGRGLVRVLRVKSFGERTGGRTRERLAHVEPAGYTRMGGAIRHATALLERAAPGMRRVLVLVSDGFPYDEGYEGAQATADTRQAMWEARRLGIGCVCVGVTAPSPEELRSQADALAAASALHVGDTGEIERRLGGLVRRALRDARRRSDHDGVVTVG